MSTCVCMVIMELGNSSPEHAASVNKPALNVLLQAVDQPDIMDCLLVRNHY